MMRYWVVDSETTGTEENDKACEVAGFLCEGTKIISHYQTLVNPGIPIPAIASAVHHITDKDVKDAPNIEDAMAPFFDEDFDFVVAHNADFDMRMMDFGEAPWVCTWKLANKVYPDAPSYKLQVLRYYLGLPDPVIAQAQFAHRGLYDSEVCSHLFFDLLSKAVSDDPVDKMIQISSNPILLRKVGFGKHAGQMWADVPRSYLDFILHKSSGWDANVLHTARYYYG